MVAFLKFLCMAATAFVFACTVFHVVSGNPMDAAVYAGLTCLDFLLFFNGVMDDRWQIT